jgi:hypothetical protein
LNDIYHGIDFSGASNPRNKIWLSTWRLGDAPTTQNGFSREDLVRTLLEMAGDGATHHVLIDAPLTLPLEHLRQLGVELSWRGAAEWLRGFETPRAWRSKTRKVSRVEPRRAVDVSARTPMSPLNIRLFKQTWHALVSLVLPLLEHPESVAILPMSAALGEPERPRPERVPVRIGEGCPSSFLRSREWPHRGYKGTGASCEERRTALLALLEEDGSFSVARKAAKLAVSDTEGDALDSLLLLPSAQRFADSDPHELLTQQEPASIEGWVYV